MKNDCIKRALIFDLDGTLWDSSENVMKAWNEAFEIQNYRGPVSQGEMKACMGLPMDEIFDLLLACLPEAARAAAGDFCTAYENTYIEKHGGNLFASVKEILRALHEDYTIAIVSNCQTGYIEAFVHYYGLEDVVDDLESFGATLKSKGENIALVMERNHIDQAIYIGDIERDYTAACQAGIPFILAGYGFGNMEHPWTIDALDQLPDMAKKVFKSAYAPA